MTELERELIRLIRESDEAKKTVEEFIFGNQKSPEDQPEPFGAPVTYP